MTTLLHMIDDMALLATLAILIAWLAGAYALVITRGSRHMGAYWRNTRFIIAGGWAFNVIMFTMFYASDGTVPRWYNWVLQIGFTIATIVVSLYFDPKRRRRNKD